MTDREFLESLAVALGNSASRSLREMSPLVKTADPEAYGEWHGKAAVALATSTLICEHLERTTKHESGFMGEP